MKRDYRLSDNDMLSTDHFPIKAIFNSISDRAFVETLNPLCQGIGFGVEYGACVFYNDLDEYDKTTMEKFDGVEFGLHDGQEIVVDYKTFYYYLQKACMAYLEDFPENREKLSEILEKVKQQLNL